MIGMGRVITDYVTFAYMTDVYVLPEYRGKGLGKWMMSCVNEITEGWRSLRALWLIASNENSSRLYKQVLDAKKVGVYSSPKYDLDLMEKTGPGSNHGHL